MKSRARLSPFEVFAEMGLTGILAGLGAGLLDGFFVLRGFAGGSWAGALSYALAVDMLAGLVLGLLAAVPISLSGLVGSKAWIRCLPVAASGIAVAVLLNTTLFDGPQISQHPQLGLIKTVFYSGLVIAVLVASILFPVMLRWRPVLRCGLAGLCAVGAVAGTYAGLHVLNAYPMIKIQIALGTWCVIVTALVLIRAKWRPRPRQDVVLTLVLMVVAVASAGVARGLPGIRGDRSVIIDSPFPATLQVISPVESWLLEPVFPLADIPLPSGPAVDVVGDQDPKLRLELDALVPGRRRMHVIWIAIDALRQDHVGVYGYDRPTTPRIDAFSKECVRFRRATTPTPASALAYSSTMTGLFGRVSPAFDVQHRTGRKLPERVHVASVMKHAGHRPIGLTAFKAGSMRNPIFRTLMDGFDEFVCSELTRALKAQEVTDRALEMIDDASGHERPFFMWLHYLDPHGPYEFVPEHSFGNEQIDAYDSEIAYTDVHVGRLLDGLRDRGMYDNTIIVLFADHGEAFGEHNNWKHGGSLYSHQIDVPLMIRVPGMQPRVVEQWSGLSDLLPTTVALLGIPDDVERLGRDLTPLMLGQTDGWIDSTYAERPGTPRKIPPSRERCVCVGDLKLIWKPHHQTYQVFDLAADPTESKNLFDAKNPEHQRLLGVLDGWDRRIDAQSGRTSRSVRTTESVSELFSAAVADVVAAEEPEARAKALARVRDITNLQSIRGLPVNHALLDEKALETLSTALVESLTGMEDRAPERALTIELLTFLDDPEFLPVFRQEMKRRTSPRLLRRLALYRARHGDREVLPMLQAAFESATNTNDRIQIAEGLAYLGDDRGRPLLRAVLSVSSSRQLLPAIRGLAALRDPYPTVWFLFSFQRHWSGPLQYEAMLEVGLRDKSVLGTAALVRITSGARPHVAKIAREELARRLSREQLSRVTTVSRTLAAAHNSATYRRYELMPKRFASLTAADDPLVGPGWWMLAQSGWEAGSAADRDRGIERLLAAASGHPVLEQLAARMTRYRSGPPRPAAREFKLTARIVGGPITHAPKPRGLFHATIELKNDSKSFVSGGWWRTGPLLAFDTGPPGAPALAVPLPPSGLEPGETTSMVVVGQWPRQKGSYTPELVVVRRPHAKPVARLLTLETQVIE